MSNTFRSNYLPIVKHPFSKLKYPHQEYFILIEDFLSFMYEGIDFIVRPYREGYDIIILNVNPFKEYNPFNFDPSYRVKVGETVTKECHPGRACRCDCPAHTDNSNVSSNTWCTRKNLCVPRIGSSGMLHVY